MIKRKRHRRKSRFRKRCAAVAAAIAALVGAAGGYEYCTTGSIDRTRSVLSELSGYIQDAPEQADRLETAARRQINRWMNGDDGNTTLDPIPEYRGSSYVELYGNVPEFTEEERNSPPYEFYSELDWLGRCGYAEAKITGELMPEEERGQIGMIQPTGWHLVKYEGIDGNYLYNRCHLIGYQLTGENANEKNLITGTRYLNVTGMLPWENMVADYIRDTGGAVLYRVTPVYEGDNLLASGVEMEAQSVGSDEVSFHVFVFNVQPGIVIDYATGDSRAE